MLTRASFRSLYRGTYHHQAGPQTQTQSSDLLDSPNGVGPIFFASAPSSLALSLLGLAPSTVQDGCRPCVAATVGARVPGCGGEGGPNGANGALLQPTPVWGTGGVTTHPRKSHRPVKARAKTTPVSCLGTSGRPRVAVSVPVLTWYADIWFRHGQEDSIPPFQKSGKEQAERNNAPWMLTRYPCVK